MPCLSCFRESELGTADPILPGSLPAGAGAVAEAVTRLPAVQVVGPRRPWSQQGAFGGVPRQSGGNPVGAGLGLNALPQGVQPGGNPIEAGVPQGGQLGGNPVGAGLGPGAGIQGAPVVALVAPGNGVPAGDAVAIDNDDDANPAVVPHAYNNETYGKVTTIKQCFDKHIKLVDNDKVRFKQYVHEAVGVYSQLRVRAWQIGSLFLMLALKDNLENPEGRFKDSELPSLIHGGGAGGGGGDKWFRELLTDPRAGGRGRTRAAPTTAVLFVQEIKRDYFGGHPAQPPPPTGASKITNAVCREMSVNARNSLSENFFSRQKAGYSAYLLNRGDVADGTFLF